MSFAADSFTGTATTELHDYDANWIHHPTDSTLTYLVISNANRARQFATQSGGNHYYHNTAPSSANYSVSVNVYAAGTTNVLSAGVLARANATAATWYYGDLSDGGWRCYKRVAGSWTQLGSTVAHSESAGNNYPIKLEVNGSSISVYGDGSLVIGPVTDSAITDAGYAGIRCDNALVGDSSGFHIDDFAADYLAAATGSPWYYYAMQG